MKHADTEPDLGTFVHKRSDRLGWASDLADQLDYPLDGRWVYELADSLDDPEALAQAARRRAFFRGCRCEPNVTMVVDPDRQAVMSVVDHEDHCSLGGQQ